MKKRPPVMEKKSAISRRSWYFALWGAGVLALAWRLIAAYEIASGGFAYSIFQPAAATDLRTYMVLAEEVATGKFNGPFYYQPFYYSVFLVLCRWISGASVWGVVLIQALLGAFTAMTAGLSAARLGGRIAGLITAYLTALCTILVFYTPFHQIATLQTFNLAVMSYFAIRAFQSGKYRHTAAFALFAAIGDLTRGNILLIFVPLCIALFAVFYKRFKLKKALASLFLCIGIFLLAESPFIIYNSMQLGRLCGPSTAADAVLALGNTPEAPPGGRDPGLPAGPMEYPQAYHIWMSDCETVPVWKKILNYLSEEPAAYLELTFRKLLLFWDAREIPNNVSLAGEGTSSKILKLTVPPGILLALGVAGMFLLMKKLRKAPYLALYITVIFYWGATAAFYNLARFRAPVLPELAIFSGLFIAGIVRRSRNDDWKFIRSYGVFSLAAGIFFAFGAYEFYRQTCEKSVLRMVRPQGTKLVLPDKRQVEFYHGPMTFGGWYPVEVKKLQQLQIKFPAAEKLSGKSEVEFSVQSQRAGNLIVAVNGKTLAVEFKSPEFRKITVPLNNAAADGNVIINVLYNGAEAVFIADRQRNYQASYLDGTVLDGELVVRLTR
ncbi:MAG: glycosyltransferase family 39 protein [Lentisphaeria bacterium]|nr:glycosyltransferase family 39 protein [Lentisphaeria bacterium]